MATINDVAKRAGVSKMTVSRVINNSGYISDKTRSTVEQAIKELGYIPNALARSLRHKQTSTIALVITDITNPFFTTIARGVEDAAKEHGFTVMYGNTDESQEEEIAYLTVLIQKQVDGVLLVPSHDSQASIDLLQQHKIPFVILDRRIPDADVDTVRGDSIGGAYTITCHLIDLGHRNIAFLGGPSHISTARERLFGYRQALTDAGIDTAGNERVYAEAFNYEGGFELAQQVIQADPMPTAIFAYNNFVAIGALHALRQANLRVPEDISLVVFDDLPESILIDPFFTTVVQPAYEMGQTATQLLLKRLTDTEPSPTQDIVLPTRSVLRLSSRRLGQAED